MEISIIALPLIASIISGFFGKFIGDRNSEILTSVLVSISALLSIYVLYQVIVNQYEENIADIVTNKLVTISEFLSPINFPKKPEIIEAIKGNAIIEISILSLQLIYFFNTYCSRVSKVNYYNC